MYHVGMVTKSLVKGAATSLGNPSKYPKLGYQVANLGSQALLFFYNIGPEESILLDQIKTVLGMDSLWCNIRNIWFSECCEI